MRCDQWIGLPAEALAFLAVEEMPEEKCPECGRGLGRKLEEIGSYEGMFGQRCPLFRHFLKDGRTADEFLQASPWDCGPMFYLGLRVSDGREFVWPNDEVNGVIGAEKDIEANDAEVREDWY